jgi:hypothetical protein
MLFAMIGQWQTSLWQTEHCPLLCSLKLWIFSNAEGLTRRLAHNGHPSRLARPACWVQTDETPKVAILSMSGGRVPCHSLTVTGGVGMQSTHRADNFHLTERNNLTRTKPILHLPSVISAKPSLPRSMSILTEHTQYRVLQSNAPVFICSPVNPAVRLKGFDSSLRWLLSSSAPSAPSYPSSNVQRGRTDQARRDEPCPDDRRRRRRNR